MAAKNYITPTGLKRLQQELRKLKYEERPEVTQTVAWAASNGDRSENGDYLYGKKRLREIDSRIRFLSKQIENAEVIDPATIKASVVQFGATVTFEDEDGNQKTYSIVGSDESDVSQGRISWLSPLASSLLRHRVGDVVTFSSPKGEQEIEIIDLDYRALSDA